MTNNINYSIYLGTLKGIDEDSLTSAYNITPHVSAEYNCGYATIPYACRSKNRGEMRFSLAFRFFKSGEISVWASDWLHQSESSSILAEIETFAAKKKALRNSQTQIMYKIICHVSYNHSDGNDWYCATEKKYDTVEHVNKAIETIFQESKGHNSFPLSAEKILDGYFAAWSFDDDEFVYQYQIAKISRNRQILLDTTRKAW